MQQRPQNTNRLIVLNLLPAVTRSSLPAGREGGRRPRGCRPPSGLEIRKFNRGKGVATVSRGTRRTIISGEIKCTTPRWREPFPTPSKSIHREGEAVTVTGVSPESIRAPHLSTDRDESRLRSRFSAANHTEPITSRDHQPPPPLRLLLLAPSPDLSFSSLDGTTSSPQQLPIPPSCDAIAAFLSPSATYSSTNGARFS